MSVSETDCIFYWEFKINCRGTAALISSNPVILNFICSTLANHDDQLLVKIKINRSEANICIFTRGNEAKKLLLSNYSSNDMFKELENIGDSFSDISSIELVKMGFVLDLSSQEFEEIKQNVQTTLKNRNTFTSQTEVSYHNCTCF